MRNVARVEAHAVRVSEQEQQAAAQFEQSVRSQASRTCNARRRENDIQQRKLQMSELAEQKRVTWRAQVLP